MVFEKSKENNGRSIWLDTDFVSLPDPSYIQEKYVYAFCYGLDFNVYSNMKRMFKAK